MARYEHLPIYKKAKELSLYLEEAVRNFSRYHKYTQGAELRELSREIVRRIIRVNSLEHKTDDLLELVVSCDMMKDAIVFAKETKAFQNFNQFQHAAMLAEVLCKQSQGWLQSSKKKGQNHQPPSKAEK